MTKRAAEMRGIAKPVAEGDLRDRMMRLRRIRQVRRTALQPAFAHIMREAGTGALEQLLQVALGYSLGLGDPGWREIRIVELAFDHLADAMQDRRLRRGAARVRRRRRALRQECRQQV